MPDRAVVRGLGLAIAGVTLAGLLAAVARDGDDVPDAGGRVTVDGEVTVVHLDGAVERLETGDIVRAGERVEVESGSVVIELADGGRLEGRDGGDAVPATRLVVDRQPELVAGELLLVGDRGLAVEAAGTVIELAGDDAAARLGRTLSVAAASYRGGLALDSAGQERTVPALRQMGVPSLGRPPRVPEPLDLRAADPWDRRFLGAAIDLGRSLDAASVAFTANAPPGSATSASLFETALPRLADEPAFEPALRRSGDRSPGELLVGAAIASLGSGGSFADRWDATFGFRDQGAAWGLVALDRGVADRVLGEVEAALGRTAEVPEVAGPLPGSGAPGSTSPTAPPGTSGTGTTQPPTGDAPPPPPTEPAPTTPTTPPPTLPPPTVPSLPPPLPSPSDEDDGGIVPETGDPLLDSLTEPIDEILGGLLD